MVDFLFGRLFFLDMILIGYILTAHFPRRDGALWKAPLSVLLCLGVSLLWDWLFGWEVSDNIPLQLLYSTANYLSAMLILLAALSYYVQVQGWALAYVGAMMWFCQQLINSLIFMTGLQTGTNLAGLIFHCITLLLVSLGVYYWFARRIEISILERIDLRTVMPVWLMMCVACLEINSYASNSDQASTAYYLAIIVVDLMGLLYQKSLYQFAGLERMNESVEMLLEQSRKQYVIAKESIDQVNIKCHDLRHQIRHFQQAGQIDEHVLRSMEQAVDDYDTAVRTGNQPLDVILTEKSMICRNHNIGFTCMADGRGIGYMEAPDMYALFGNALENAIEATEALQDPERRQISFTMRQAGAFYSIQVQNYTDHNIQIENGLPVTSKTDKANHGFGVRSMQLLVEKYEGELSFRQDGDVFSLYMLLPYLAEAPVASH